MRARHLLAALVVSLAVLVLVGCGNGSNGTSTGSDQSGNYVTQTYWYCWDSGPPAPHHFGHRVTGDHLCTKAELGR